MAHANGKWMTIAVLLATLMVSNTLFAQEQRGTVLLSGEDCGYVLLDIGNGQALLKLIDGELPRPGDRLQGTLVTSDFNEMENNRTRELINVWVDLVERTSTRALTRYSQHCAR